MNAQDYEYYHQKQQQSYTYRSGGQASEIQHQSHVQSAPQRHHQPQMMVDSKRHTASTQDQRLYYDESTVVDTRKVRIFKI